MERLSADKSRIPKAYGTFASLHLILVYNAGMLNKIHNSKRTRKINNNTHTRNFLLYNIKITIIFY
jgi:hypothetical protein